MVKLLPESFDPAPLKLYYQSIVSTETFNPSWKIFVVSTNVINIISLPCSKQSIKIRLALKKFRCLGGFLGALSYLALTRLVCATEHDNQVFRNLSSGYTLSILKVHWKPSNECEPWRQVVYFSATTIVLEKQNNSMMLVLLMVEPLGHSVEAYWHNLAKVLQKKLYFVLKRKTCKKWERHQQSNVSHHLLFKIIFLKQSQTKHLLAA